MLVFGVIQEFSIESDQEIAMNPMVQVRNSGKVSMRQWKLGKYMYQKVAVKETLVWFCLS